ncbi:hypothetical protein GW916_10465 [bacterium]|nr:hypothetical protein [bacterium]
MMTREEIQEALQKIAFQKSAAFCYQDYIKCPTGRCPICGSDDLMRHLEGVGVEWGTSWVIEHILQEELTPVALEEIFKESIRQCYPEEVKVGWITVDTIEVLKSQDPISWGCALSDYESQEEEEGTIMSFDNGSSYYWTHEVEALLEK